MKLLSVTFKKPVKIKGDMVTSLNSTTEVGRLGARKNVSLEVSENLSFVEVSQSGEIAAIVPMTNVNFFVPAPLVKPVPVPAPSVKK